MITTATPTTAAAPSRSRLGRLAGPLLALGGLLWVLTFALIVVNGALTGTLPNQPDAVSPLALRVGIRLFALSVVVLGVGLWALAPRFAARAKWPTRASLLLTSVAMAMTAVNLVTLSGLAGEPSYSDTLGGLSVFVTSLGALLVGAGAARTRGTNRGVTAALLFVGLTTIPTLIMTPLPVGPDWATDFLAFLTSGAAFIALGALVGAGREG
ncbi:MAG TPA: hypothetical protein PKD53_09495 [Chloroflexaceae bacterium]|nr:hypothetical protein [Chloroflexaceae bacterium]